MTWPCPQPKNILVRMPNWLGDAVMATPILQDLRRHYPKAKITAMCLSKIAPLLSHDPHLDEIFSFTRQSGWLHRIHEKNVINRLQEGKYDLGILLTNSFSSAFCLWRGKVKNLIGFRKNLRSFFLSKSLSSPSNKEKQHQVLTYKALLQPLGIPLSNSSPQLFTSPEDIKNADQLLTLHEYEPHCSLIGINPGAAYGLAKCWPLENFQKLTHKLLSNPKIHVLFFGDESSKPLVDKICKNIPSRVSNLAGQTPLPTFLALIQKCNVFLSNDSGPMHLCAALKTPLLALFGSTSPIKTGPYEHGTIIQKPVECSPCYKRVCPIDFRCMKQIEVDEVFMELQKALANELS